MLISFFKDAIMSNKNPLLPILENWSIIGRSGLTYKVEVRIEQTSDQIKFPPSGIKCSFKVMSENLFGKNELLILIDNHEPHGFHYHDRLPEVHDSRKSINAKNWQKAWNYFDQILKEIINES